MTIYQTPANVLNAGSRENQSMTNREDSELRGFPANVRSQLFRTLVDCSPDALLITDVEGVIVFANETCFDLLEHEPATLLGQPIEVLVPDTVRPDHAGYRKDFTSMLEARSMGRLSHLKAKTASGTCIPVDIALTPLMLENHQFVMITVRDAARQHALINELNSLASTDPLTGALNRRSFYKVAERELERKTRYKTPVSVMMIDIDHFKHINDAFGHNAGDKALIEMSQVCMEHLRKNDGFARLGGEEFAIIASEIGLEPATHLAERLRQALSSLSIETDRGNLGFTVSIGLTEVTQEDDTIEPCLKRADTALYGAKESGRNRVVTAI